jgi:hypothetical protein
LLQDYTLALAHKLGAWVKFVFSKRHIPVRDNMQGYLAKAIGVN